MMPKKLSTVYHGVCKTCSLYKGELRDGNTFEDPVDIKCASVDINFSYSDNSFVKNCPCRICLVLPTCKISCDEYKTYKKSSEDYLWGSRGFLND